MKTLAAIFLLAAACTAATAQRVLLNGSIAVPAGRHYRIPFDVTADANHVIGRFNAQGSINTFILDNDGYTNFSGGSQSATYYNSGNVVVANINVRLSPGSYYLVFQNKNILDNKTVDGNIGLYSDRPINTYNSERREPMETPSVCTVKRSGATFYLTGSRLTVRLKSGTRLQYIDHPATTVFVRYKGSEGVVMPSTVICR